MDIGQHTACDAVAIAALALVGMRRADGGGRDGANRVKLFHRGCEHVLLTLLALPVLTTLAEVVEELTLGRGAAESVTGGPAATDITIKQAK